MTAPVAPRGFTEAAVNELIERRSEPEWLRERRLAAWKLYQQIPMPTRTDEEWRRTDLSRLRLDQLTPHAVDQTGAASLRPVAEREEAYGGFLGLRNGHPVEHHLSADLVREGVIFTDLATAVREHGDLVREHFMTRCVLASESKFAALHGAFWETGTFLYVPRGVVVTEPLRSVVQADLQGTSSLAHTLIVLEPGAQVTFAEDYTSPEGPEQGFSSRMAELLLKRDAVLHYVGVQRWGRSVFDFHTERAML
ncbi:MAG: SufD family Fe-S cluster assembly protein, partial [Ktedonobacterales bacterium]|nr:SufD family Fe-S cluster assembly protein [Ktedonobacterales bacterium]